MNTSDSITSLADVITMATATTTQSQVFALIHYHPQNTLKSFSILLFLAIWIKIIIIIIIIKSYICKVLWQENVLMNHNIPNRILFQKKKERKKILINQSSVYVFSFWYNMSLKMQHISVTVPNSVERVLGKVVVVLKNVFFCVFLSIWTFRWRCQKWLWLFIGLHVLNLPSKKTTVIYWINHSKNVPP